MSANTKAVNETPAYFSAVEGTRRMLSQYLNLCGYFTMKRQLRKADPSDFPKYARVVVRSFAKGETRDRIVEGWTRLGLLAA